jgi:DNA invertase Pin-like site-specific DNA recombinase
MPTNEIVPAAQYLRMSTEDQKYSLDNQAVAIQRYAELHGFGIIQTYSDTAKSGVVLRNRAALQQLLHDVVGGEHTYRAILVYDVSRWGRFQDADEAAHYEFLCKSAGVPVHYCAETFANDGTLSSMIMKSLKRTMAGEYSRELGVKVLAGQKRLARLGFKQGGMPGYGLRRMLLSAAGTPKQELALGERKSIATDRVVLVPGPAAEVQVVKEIYRLLVSEKRSPYAIAQELNHRGVEFVRHSKWDYQAVFKLLTHPKYSGCHVFNRTSAKLHTQTISQPISEWVLTPGAFTPIIDLQTFERAQEILCARTINRTDEDLLEKLRILLALKGRLSLTLIQNSPDLPSPSTYRHRFGSLRETYRRIGYGAPEQFGPFDMRQRTRALRDQLIAELVSRFPGLSIVKRGGRWRSRLRMPNGRMIAVLVARSVRVWKDTTRWLIDPIEHERRLVTLLARLDTGNKGFLDFYLMPGINRRTRLRISPNDPWLERGMPLRDLSEFSKLISGKPFSRSSR